MHRQLIIDRLNKCRDVEISSQFSTEAKTHQNSPQTSNKINPSSQFNLNPESNFAQSNQKRLNSIFESLERHPDGIFYQKVILDNPKPLSRILANELKTLMIDRNSTLEFKSHQTQCTYQPQKEISTEPFLSNLKQKPVNVTPSFQQSSMISGSKSKNPLKAKPQPATVQDDPYFHTFRRIPTLQSERNQLQQKYDCSKYQFTRNDLRNQWENSRKFHLKQLKAIRLQTQPDQETQLNHNSILQNTSRYCQKINGSQTSRAHTEEGEFLSKPIHNQAAGQFQYHGHKRQKRSNSRLTIFRKQRSRNNEQEKYFGKNSSLEPLHEEQYENQRFNQRISQSRQISASNLERVKTARNRVTEGKDKLQFDRRALKSMENIRNSKNRPSVISLDSRKAPLYTDVSDSQQCSQYVRKLAPHLSDPHLAVKGYEFQSKRVRPSNERLSLKDLNKRIQDRNQQRLNSIRSRISKKVSQPKRCHQQLESQSLILADLKEQSLSQIFCTRGLLRNEQQKRKKIDREFNENYLLSSVIGNNSEKQNMKRRADNRQGKIAENKSTLNLHSYLFPSRQDYLNRGKLILKNSGSTKNF